MSLTPEQEQAVLRAKTEVGSLIGFCESLKASQHRLSDGSDFLLIPVAWKEGLMAYIKRTNDAVTNALSQTQSELEQAQLERDSLQVQRDQVLHLLDGGTLTEQQVKDSGLGEGLLIERRYLDRVGVKELLSACDAALHWLPDNSKELIDLEGKARVLIMLLATAQRERDEVRAVWLAEHKETCLHHTDAERKAAGCPVCRSKHATAKINKGLEGAQRDELQAKLDERERHTGALEEIERLCPCADCPEASDYGNQDDYAKAFSAWAASRIGDIARQGLNLKEIQP